MRFAVSTITIAALMLAGACSAEPHDTDAARAEADADSTLAVTAAEAVAATLRGTVLGRDRSQNGVMLQPGAGAWDSLFARELQRAEPSMSTPPADSARAMALATHGFERKGDTAVVMVVLRTCAPQDSSFNYSRDSLVHRMVRSAGDDRGWRLAGSVEHDHAIGICEPADSAAAREP